MAGSKKDEDDDKVAERAGTFKRRDIYKMHTYRDAIPAAGSAWILYPGSQFRFFAVPRSGVPSGGHLVLSPGELPTKLEGVGAIPLAPASTHKIRTSLQRGSASDRLLRETLRRVIGIGGLPPDQ